MVSDLNRHYEAEWAGLLASPEASPKALKVHADARRDVDMVAAWSVDRLGRLLIDLVKML